MTFMAALHGVDLKDSKNKSKNSSSSKGEQTNPVLFDAPENYAKMNEEDRQKQTQDMMKHMQQLFNKTRMG